MFKKNSVQKIINIIIIGIVIISGVFLSTQLFSSSS